MDTYEMQWQIRGMGKGRSQLKTQTYLWAHPAAATDHCQVTATASSELTM